MPPKPNKKAQIIILIDIFFRWIVDTRLIPFVSSIIPDKIGSANEESIPKKESAGVIKLDNKSKICSSFNIEITTEKITTNEPIISIVDIAFDELLFLVLHILILLSICF